MEEDKKEEIKKILQESLSKMHEKAQNNETNKDKEQEYKHELIDESSQEEIIIKEEPLEEKLNTSKNQETIEETKIAINNDNIKEKEEINEIKVDKINIGSGSGLLPTLIIVATLLFIAVIFSFVKDDLFKETPVEDKPIVMKEVKSPEEIMKNNQFVKETKDIEEIKKEEPKTIEIKTEEKSKEIEKETKEEKKQVKIIEQKVIKVVEVQKEVLSIPAFKKFYNGSDYKKSTCYDYKAGSTQASNECKVMLKKFLEKNKKAIRFEIIAVLGEDDFKIFKDLKTQIKNYATDDRVKEFIYRGLGRERVLEISWHVKEIMGEDIVLTPTNYYVKSQKNNRGFLIKAYY